MSKLLAVFCQYMLALKRVMFTAVDDSMFGVHGRQRQILEKEMTCFLWLDILTNPDIPSAKLVGGNMIEF